MDPFGIILNIAFFVLDKIFGRKSKKLLELLIARQPTKENIEKLILHSDPKNDWHGRSTNEMGVVTYNNDVNLRFEEKHNRDGIQCDDFKAEWANCHPNAKAIGCWFDLYYGSSLLERFILVGVDGCTALLPIPKPSDSKKVLPLEYKVAQIHDTTNTLPEYMERSGLSVGYSTQEVVK